MRLVARKGSNFDPAFPEDQTIGAAVASDWLEEKLPVNSNLILLANSESHLAALVSGKGDALFGDSLGFWSWLQTPDGSGFEFAGEGNHLDEGVGIAVRKEDIVLQQQLDEDLEATLVDGTYGAINARSFLFSIYQGNNDCVGTRPGCRSSEICRLLITRADWLRVRTDCQLSISIGSVRVASRNS